MTKKKSNPTYSREPVPVPTPVAHPVEQEVVPVEPPIDQPVVHEETGYIQVVANYLNCREEPTMTAHVLRLLNKGMTAKVIGHATCEDGYEWLHLEDYGWVRVEFTEPIEG